MNLRLVRNAGFAETQMPAPHEFFCPMEALMREDGHEDPQMQALIRRTSAAENFMVLPEPGTPAAPLARAPSPANTIRRPPKKPPSMRFIDSLYRQSLGKNQG